MTKRKPSPADDPSKAAALVLTDAAAFGNDAPRHFSNFPGIYQPGVPVILADAGIESDDDVAALLQLVDDNSLPLDLVYVDRPAVDDVDEDAPEPPTGAPDLTRVAEPPHGQLEPTPDVADELAADAAEDPTVTTSGDETTTTPEA